jgi:hypothetical protein
VFNTIELNAGDSSSRERRKNNAAQAVAKRVAIARVEPVYLVHTLLLCLGHYARFAGQSYRILNHNAIVLLIIINGYKIG